MPNTVAGLTPEAEIRVLEVLRESMAMTRLVTVNKDDIQVPVRRGSTVDINQINEFTTRQVVPGVTPPATGENEIDPKVDRLTLDQHEESSFILTNQELLAISAGESETFDEAIRSVCYSVNASLTGLYTHVYNAVGTPGTTPFVADTQVLGDANALLDIAKAPMSMRRLTLDPFSYNQATQLGIFQRVNESGTSQALRDAMIPRAVGYDWGMDQQVAQHTSTAAGAYAIAAAATAGVNSRTITVDNGAGALPTPMAPGDLFTIAGSTQQYSVVSYTANATDATVVISPGLVADVNPADAITISAASANHRANLAFHRSAFHIATRIEAQADLSVLPGYRSNRVRSTITDPQTGVAMTVEFYDEYHQTRCEVSVMWGVVCARPQLACRILG